MCFILLEKINFMNNGKLTVGKLGINRIFQLCYNYNQINSMDASKDRKFLLYLGLGATLGAAYFAIDYLSNRKTSKAKPLTLEKTKKILQQIKFQILTTCTTFVQGLKNRPKTNHSQKDLEIFYRSELAKVYEMREDTILAKFIVSKDQYASSLLNYKKDSTIHQGQKQILDILQNATKNIFPDYTVPRQAKNLLSSQQVPQVYLEMCELISVKVWQKLDSQKQNNPGFNSKDDTHFKKAIRQISIYDIKSEFLQKKGFKPQWGCPNQVFYKVMESLKQENKEIKNRANKIEKAYEKIIERITNQPQHLNVERIKFLFDQIVNNKVPEIKPAPQVQQRHQAPIENQIQNIPKKVAPPAKKDDDFNMDELMMQQLMSRSQEELKQALRVETVPVVEISQQVVEQPKIQQPKENLEYVVQKDNQKEVRQQEVEKQVLIQVVKQEEQQPQANLQKIQVCFEVVQNEVVQNEVIKNVVLEEPVNSQEKVEVNQIENRDFAEVIVVGQSVEEIKAQVITVVKEQEKAQIVAAEVVAQPQEQNPVIQNQAQPEQELQVEQQ